MTKRSAAREAARTAAAIGLGQAIGESLRGFRIQHHMEVTHSYERPPQVTRVYAEIANSEGQIWREAGYSLGPGQTALALPGVPISWITGRREDDALGQTTICLRFEYDR